jgi:hypothetical protein
MRLSSRAYLPFGLVLVLVSTELVGPDQEGTTTKPQSQQAESGSASAKRVVTAPALSQPLDLGSVMLRSIGSDGVFSFDEGSDDIVDWAEPIEPVDLTKVSSISYKFGALPPFGAHCRIFHAPFPSGIEPPLPLNPPEP